MSEDKDDTVSDTDSEAASTTAKPAYKPRKPRNILLVFLMVLVLALAAIGGIGYAVFSTHKDPEAITFPEHMTKSLADDIVAQEQELSDKIKHDAANAVENTQAVIPDDMSDIDMGIDDAEDDGVEVDLRTQDEAPLLMDPSVIPPASTPEPVSTEEPVLDPTTEPAETQEPEQHSSIVPATPITPTAQSGVHTNGMIAIVIDDMGLNQPNARAMARLPSPLTLAYMPYAERLPIQTQDAYDHGHELIVHMPMEPEDVAHNNPGPNALLVSLGTDEIRKRVQNNLSHFEKHVGFNNHMGSKFTADAARMRTVLTVAKEKGLWFLDSKTSEGSQAAKVASELGVPYAVRDVFLDNVQEVKAVLTQLRQMESIARKRGYAIAIGHPHTATIEALRIWIPQARQNGITLVPLSAIIAQRFPKADVPRYARIHKTNKTEPAAEAVAETHSSVGTGTVPKS